MTIDSLASTQSATVRRLPQAKAVSRTLRLWPAIVLSILLTACGRAVVSGENAAQAQATSTTQPSFSVSVGPSSLALTGGGGAASVSVRVTGMTGMQASVALSVQQVPTGIQVSPLPKPLPNGGTAVISVAATTTATVGSGQLQLVAQAGPVNHTVWVPFTVTSKAVTKSPPASGASLIPGPITFPTGFMTSVKTYGAVGDGVTDDTEAIQQALSDGRTNASADYFGMPKALFFPPGVYLVRDTLTWNGCCLTLQGSGSSSSVIRLASGAPGYGSAVNPKAVLLTPAPGQNRSFRQNIWDLGISVGTDNPGAVGVDYVSNNSGSLRNISLVSEDGNAGVGVSLMRHYPGPLLLKNVAITGFQKGIQTSSFEYGVTIEGLTLSGQGTAGISNHDQTLSIRNLCSLNKVPALINDGGFVVLLDAVLGGGLSTADAIQNNANLYLRNISATGYARTLTDSSAASPTELTGTIGEYLAGGAVRLASTAGASSLGLSVQETPAATDSPLATWSTFTPRYYGDTKGLAALFQGSYSTIYFPTGSYFAYNQASIPVSDAVQHIIGYTSVINGNAAGQNGGGYRLVVNSNSTTPLVIEQFGYGLTIEHHGTRPIVLKHGSYAYVSYAGAGNVFLEDVQLGQVVFQPGQTVWARQLNDEFAGTKITNRGTLWMLGLKTEAAGTVVQTEAGGRTELLGSLVYPAAYVPSSDVAFRSSDASVSYIYAESVYCTGCGYVTQVMESKGGVPQEVNASGKSRFVMPLFIGK